MTRHTDECNDGRVVRNGSFLKAWLPLVSLLFALHPAHTEAQTPPLSETGRWQGPYFLGAPYPENAYQGAHVAVLKGPGPATWRATSSASRSSPAH